MGCEVNLEDKNVVGEPHYIMLEHVFACHQELRRLRASLFLATRSLLALENDIVKHASDTIWCGNGETASERIYGVLVKLEEDDLVKKLSIWQGEEIEH